MEQASGINSRSGSPPAASGPARPDNGNRAGVTVVDTPAGTQPIQTASRLRSPPESVPAISQISSRKSEIAVKIVPRCFDLSSAFGQFFSSASRAKTRELITCLSNSIQTAHSKKERHDELTLICRDLLKASNQQNENVRSELLNQLEIRCITLLSKIKEGDSEGKKLLACVWWCRLLGDEMSALQAMQCVPEAKLCHMTEDISRSLLFRSANAFLNCRLVMIRRHGAEHGDPKALTWLINRCLIDEQPGEGFSCEEGFRWLDTYRKLIKRRILPEPAGDDLFARLVRDGRDFKKDEASAKQQLLAIGMHLDHRFGQIDRYEAEELLFPFFSGKSCQYTKRDMSLAWLWRGYLAMPIPYQPEPGSPSPEICFRKSMELGCSDAEVKLIWVLLSLSHNRTSDRALHQLERLVNQLSDSHVECRPPEIWGPFSLAASRVYPEKSGGLSGSEPEITHSKSQKQLARHLEEQRKKREDIQSRRLVFASCHGQPDARTIWLGKHLPHFYVKAYMQRTLGSNPNYDSNLSELIKKWLITKESKQLCRYLKLLEHVETDAATLVYRACGNENPVSFEHTDDTGSADCLLNLAVELDAPLAAALLAHLKVETTGFTIERLGRLLSDSLPGISPFKRLAVNHINREFSLPEAPFEVVQKPEILLEYQLASQSDINIQARLQQVLLDKGEEGRAFELCAYPPPGPDEKTFYSIKKPDDIRAGKYRCIHETRARIYDFASFSLIKNALTPKAVKAVTDQISQWKLSVTTHIDHPMVLWGNILKAQKTIFYCVRTIPQKDVAKVIELFREAVKSYDRAADKAERLLVGKVQSLAMKSQSAPAFLQRLQVLRNDGQDNPVNMEQLFIPVSDDSFRTVAAFSRLDKNNPAQLLAFAKTITPTTELKKIKRLTGADVPEFIWHMLITLEQWKHYDSDWEQHIETLVGLTELLILESRKYCDKVLLDFMICLQRLCVSQPDCFPYKHNLWRDLLELTACRRDRQWDCSSIKYALQGDSRRFYDEVERQSTPADIAEALKKSFCDDPESFWERLKPIRKKTEVEIAGIIDSVAELHRDRDTQTVQNCRIITKLIREQYDEELWRALTIIPAHFFPNYYVYAMALISSDLAFQDRFTNSKIVDIFRKLQQGGVHSACYFLHLWYKKRGQKGARSALIYGMVEKSPMCILELARINRNNGKYRKSADMCNKITDEGSFLFGDAQFELGETTIEYGEPVTLDQRQKAYEHWSRACRYHQPVAFCRLFTCLYPEPDARWCPDVNSQWRDKAFIMESLQLPCAYPSAGREVCHQLLLMHHNKPWDMQTLEKACEQLTSSEILLLAQLPESFWPVPGLDIEETEKRSLRAGLLERAVSLINNHRIHGPSDSNVDVIASIAIRDLTYYREIASQLLSREQLSPRQNTSVEQPEAEDNSAETEPKDLAVDQQQDTTSPERQKNTEGAGFQPGATGSHEQEMLPASPGTDGKETCPVIMWPEGEVLETSEQVTSCLQEALARKSDRVFRHAIRVVFKTHGEQLGLFVTGRLLKTHVARWLFADGHVRESLELSKQSASESHHARFLLKRLIDAGKLGMPKASESVMQELLSIDWRIIRLKEESLQHLIELFISGAYARADTELCSSIMVRIIDQWPQPWENSLLETLEQNSNPAPPPFLATSAMSAAVKKSLSLQAYAAGARKEDLKSYGGLAGVADCLSSPRIPVHHRLVLSECISDHELKTQPLEVLRELFSFTFRLTPRGRLYEALKSVSVPHVYSLYAGSDVPDWMEAGTFENAMMDLWKQAPAKPSMIRGIVLNRIGIEKRQARKSGNKAAAKRKIAAQLSQKNLIGLTACFERLLVLEPAIRNLESQYYQEITMKMERLHKHYEDCTTPTGYEETVQWFFCRSGLSRLPAACRT